MIDSFRFQTSNSGRVCSSWSSVWRSHLFYNPSCWLLRKEKMIMMTKKEWVDLQMRIPNTRWENYKKEKKSDFTSRWESQIWWENFKNKIRVTLPPDEGIIKMKKEWAYLQMRSPKWWKNYKNEKRMTLPPDENRKYDERILKIK